MMLPTIPKFENETAEAAWWYDHRDEVSKDIILKMKQLYDEEGKVE